MTAICRALPPRCSQADEIRGFDPLHHNRTSSQLRPGLQNSFVSRVHATIDWKPVDRIIIHNEGNCRWIDREHPGAAGLQVPNRSFLQQAPIGGWLQLKSGNALTCAQDRLRLHRGAPPYFASSNYASSRRAQYSCCRSRHASPSRASSTGIRSPFKPSTSPVRTSFARPAETALEHKASKSLRAPALQLRTGRLQARALQL